MTWEKVMPSDEVGRVLRRVEVCGEPVLVGRTADGRPAAVAPICPHQRRPMDGANLYGDEVDCPHHHYTYDARTGENRFPKRLFPVARAASVENICVYEVRDEDGWLWVKPGSATVLPPGQCP